MNKTYRFLTPRGKSFVYANVANVNDQLVVGFESIAATGAKIPVQRTDIVKNVPYTIVDECNSCLKTTVNKRVGLSFSGPRVAKAELVAEAEELLQMLKAGEFDALFDGFPPNATDVFEHVTTGG